MAVEGSAPKPDQLVPSTWHPGKYIVHEIKAEDNWWSVAQQHNIDVKNLIKFNFNTLDPTIINWYMHNVLRCDHRTEDGKNWQFSGTMWSNPANAGKSRPGLLYIPQDSVVFEDDPVNDPPAKT